MVETSDIDKFIILLILAVPVILFIWMVINNQNNQKNLYQVRLASCEILLNFLKHPKSSENFKNIINSYSSFGVSGLSKYSNEAGFPKDSVEKDEQLIVAAINHLDLGLVFKTEFTPSEKQSKEYLELQLKFSKKLDKLNDDYSSKNKLSLGEMDANIGSVKQDIINLIYRKGK